MLISKDSTGVLESDLMVDSWEASYEEDENTGVLSLKENYKGLTKIEKTTKQMYLGFVISDSKDNVANIEEKNQ